MTKLSMTDRLRTFGDVATGISAAGTTQATATTLPADHCGVSTVTAGSADGVILQPGNVMALRTVANHSTSAALKVFPPVGSAFNGATTNLHISIPPNGAATFWFLSTTAISAIAFGG